MLFYILYYTLLYFNALVNCNHNFNFDQIMQYLNLTNQSNNYNHNFNFDNMIQYYEHKLQNVKSIKTLIYLRHFITYIYNIPYSLEILLSLSL